MKKQILMLIIGILIGAIITTGIFLCLKNSNGNDTNHGEPPTSMDGEFMKNGEKNGNKQSSDNNNIKQETTNSNEIKN